MAIPGTIEYAIEAYEREMMRAALEKFRKLLTDNLDTPLDKA